MTTRVWRAFFASGRWKLLTPLEMASRPVSDDPPLAKERSREMKARPMSQPEPGVPIFPPNTWFDGGSGIWCSWPRASLTKPTMITEASEKMKKYVGTAKNLPASRMPRRLP